MNRQKPAVKKRLGWKSGFPTGHNKEMINCEIIGDILPLREINENASQIEQKIWHCVAAAHGNIEIGHIMGNLKKLDKLATMTKLFLIGKRFSINIPA